MSQCLDNKQSNLCINNILTSLLAGSSLCFQVRDSVRRIFSPGSSPGQEYCVVFRQDTLLSSLHATETRVKRLPGGPLESSSNVIKVVVK